MEIRRRSQNVDSDQELISWLRLIRSENVGPATFYDLLSHYGSAAEALYNLPLLSEKWRRGQPLRVCTAAEACKEIEQHIKAGASLVTLTQPAYPRMLSQLNDAPPVLSVLGQKAGLSQPSLAIVGARNASVHGRNFAYKIASELGSQGWWISSGLAHGIDTAAHEGALATGTTAVVAGGVDFIYPPENEKLYRRICAQGCIVSEAPFGAKPQASFFPRRNRIISGLSKGVIVVEAALKSGSLITARYANEQGRDVFAVPGSPFDPRCRGTNQLIQQGAALIQSCEDVLEHYKTLFSSQILKTPDMPCFTTPKNLSFEQENNALKNKIIKILSFVPISLDELTRQCETTPECVQGAVVELELENKVLRSSGGHVSLAVGRN